MSANRSTVRSAFGPGEEGPVTVVFATARYRRIVQRWIELAHRAGCHHYRIVCMDRDIARFLRREVGAHRALCFYDFLPRLPRFADEPLDWPPDPDPARRRRKHRERLQVLMPLRVKLFRFLVENGCDFIHSDADAFWLGDPRPWLMRQGAGFDLLASQGACKPLAHYRVHRFVLCAGFFYCRANDRTRDLFARADALIEGSPAIAHAVAGAEMDDQTALNRVLLKDPGRRWRFEDPAFAVRYRWTWWSVPAGRIGNALLARVLAHRVPAAVLDRALGLARSALILTSERVIDGRFSNGLRVGVIPMNLVDRIDAKRIAAAAPDRPMVSHLREHKALVPNDPHATDDTAPPGPGGAAPGASP